MTRGAATTEITVTPLTSLSKRAQKVIVQAGLVDFAEDDAADRLLSVQGCGRRTLREIGETVEKLYGRQLHGFERVMKGYDAAPTMTTADAARELGMEHTAFLDLAWKVGVLAKRRKDGRIWSEWDVIAVRRFIRKSEAKPPEARQEART